MVEDGAAQPRPSYGLYRIERVRARSTGIHPLVTRAPRTGLCRALSIEGAMGRLILTAILLAIVTPAAAQTADQLYLMDCGHNSAKDQARWSPGVNVGKPIELSDTCNFVRVTGVLRA